MHRPLARCTYQAADLHQGSVDSGAHRRLLPRRQPRHAVQAAMERARKAALGRGGRQRCHCLVSSLLAATACSGARPGGTLQLLQLHCDRAQRSLPLMRRRCRSVLLLPSSIQAGLCLLQGRLPLRLRLLQLLHLLGRRTLRLPLLLLRRLHGGCLRLCRLHCSSALLLALEGCC